jgi:hypothetical protein
MVLSALVTSCRFVVSFCCHVPAPASFIRVSTTLKVEDVSLTMIILSQDGSEPLDAQAVLASQGTCTGAIAMSAECGGAITLDVSGMPGLTYDPVTGILGADAGGKVVVMFGAGGVVTGSLRRVVKQSGSILRLEILPPPLPAAGSQPITIAVTAKAGAPASSAAVTVTFLPRNAPSLICDPSPCQSASDGGAVPVKVNITGLLLAEDTPIDEQLRVCSLARSTNQKYFDTRCSYRSRLSSSHIFLKSHNYVWCNAKASEAFALLHPRPWSCPPPTPF